MRKKIEEQGFDDRAEKAVKKFELAKSEIVLHENSHFRVEGEEKGRVLG